MARDIKMRIRSLETSENQTVKVEGVATRRYDDEEVTFLLQAKEARGLYIGQALTVTIAAEDDTEAIRPVLEVVFPRSPHPTVISLYNLWNIPTKDGINAASNPDVHEISKRRIREEWPALGRALDSLLEEPKN